MRQGERVFFQAFAQLLGEQGAAPVGVGEVVGAFDGQAVLVDVQPGLCGLGGRALQVAREVGGDEGVVVRHRQAEAFGVLGGVDVAAVREAVVEGVAFGAEAFVAGEQFVAVFYGFAGFAAAHERQAVLAFEGLVRVAGAVACDDGVVFAACRPVGVGLFGERGAEGVVRVFLEEGNEGRGRRGGKVVSIVARFEVGVERVRREVLVGGKWRAVFDGGFGVQDVFFGVRGVAEGEEEADEGFVHGVPI